MDAHFNRENTDSKRFAFGAKPHFPQANQNFARGRNLRTTDGQPICNYCQRVGHVSKYCNYRMQPPAPMFQNQHQESIQSATKFRPSLPPTAALLKPVSKPVWWEIQFFKRPRIFPVGELKTLGTPDRAPLWLEEDEFEEWTKVRMNNNSVHLRNQDPEAEQRKCETLCQDDKLPQLNNAEIPCVQTDHQNMPSNVLIWGTACKQPFKVSLDTGAAITVISEKFFIEVLRAYFAIQKSERIDNIKIADGSKVPVIGLVRFPLILGDNEYSCNATIVPGLAYSIALGRDF